MIHIEPPLFIPYKILVVDDTPANLDLLVVLLDAEGYVPLIAKNGESALRKVENSQPDLILLDIMMPEMDGFTVCQRLKSNLATRDIPVIFMTALSDTLDKVKAFELGAADYVTKPFETRELLARIETHLKLGRFQKEMQSNSIKMIEELQKLDEQNHRLKKQNERLLVITESLQKAKLAAEQVSYSKSRFLSSIAQELFVSVNTLLRYKYSFAQHIDKLTEQQFLQQVDYVCDYGKHLLELVNEILNFTQIEGGNLRIHSEVFELGKFIAGLEETLMSQLSYRQNQGRIILEENLKNIQLKLDYSLLRQILLNLWSNACKFTEKGIISLKIITLQKQEVDWICFTISDTGIGISEELQKQLRNQSLPLWTENESKIGFGLAVALYFSKIMGGYLTLESELHHGSHFHVFLPQTMLMP